MAAPGLWKYKEKITPMEFTFHLRTATKHLDVVGSLGSFTSSQKYLS